MSPLVRLVPDVVQLLGVVTGLISAAMVLAFLSSKRGAAFRHGIWLCALLGTLFSPAAIVGARRAGFRLAAIAWPEAVPDRAESPPIPPLLPSEPGRFDPDAVRAVEFDSPLEPRHDIAHPGEQVTLAPLEGGSEELSSPVQADLRTGPGPIPAAKPPQKPSWPLLLGQFALTLWAFGVLVFLIRFLRSLVLLRILRRSARLIESKRLDEAREHARLSLETAHLPPIAISPRVSSPVALGVLRPLVILPEGLAEALDPQSLRDILVHEAAHILRRDPLLGLLQRLVEMLYWPHPLVHLLNRRLARAREEICDNFVLRQSDPCRFARTLLVLAERTGKDCLPLGSLPLMNARWKLEDRVAGLLDPGRKPLTRMSRANLVWIAGMTFFTGLALSGVRIESANLAPAPDEESVLTAFAPADLPAVTKPRRIHGRVIDAKSAKPVEYASVRSVRGWRTAGPVTTGAEGTFAIEIRNQLYLEEELIATSRDGLLQGVATLHESLDSAPSPIEVEIRLEPCRTVKVRVLDARQTPVSGATVEVVADWGSIGSARTDARGLATVRFPAGRKIEQIIAVKSGVGFDYFENYQSWPSQGRIEVPESVSLVLDGARAGRIKAVDSSGKAIAGEGFYLLAIKKQGKLAHATGAFPALVSRTDGQGIALFDWLPTETEEPVWIRLWPGAWHAPVRSVFPVGDLPEETPVRLVRKATLRGKVLGTEGKPQAGIRVEAGGVGKDAEDEYDQDWTRTDADGTYAIAVAPEHSYMVGVRDAHWAARSLINIVPRREGEAYDLPGMRLIKGTIVEGRLTRAPGNQPMEGEWVSLQENGDPLPCDFKPFTWDGLEWLTRSTRTDKDGRYSFRVGPGEHELRVGATPDEKLRIGSEDTVTRDLRLSEADEPGGHLVEGLVRERAGAKPVAGALVQAVSGAQPIVARTNDQGKFEISASGDPLVFFARNRDGSQAGFGMIKKAERSVIVDLGASSSLSGRVIDHNARPCVNVLVGVWFQSPFRQNRFEKFHLETRTDSQGRYRVAGLAMGAGCELWVIEEQAGAVRSNAITVSSFVVKSSEPIVQPDIVLPISHDDKGANSRKPKSEPVAAAPAPPTVASGPSRSEIADLIRAIGRDLVSKELVDRIAAMHHPRFLWSRDFGRMKQVATDPQAVRRLDALGKEVQGKPLDTILLLRAAMLHHRGYDDAMMKQFLREWIAAESGMSLVIRGTVVDEETKQPVPFPRVFADETIASSDKDGRFELTVRRKPGSKGVSLWVEADGHASGELLAKSEDRIQVALRKDVPFFGRVVDQDGKPVAGAEVRASVHRSLTIQGVGNLEDLRAASGGPFQVRTDREGRFSFHGVPDCSSPAARSRMMEAEFLDSLALEHRSWDPRLPFQIIARQVQGKSLIDVKFRTRTSGKGNAETLSATVHAARAELRFDLAKKRIRVQFENVAVQSKDRHGDEVRMTADSLDIPFPEELWPRPPMLPISLSVSHPRFQTARVQASAPTSPVAAPLIRLQPGLTVSGQVLDTQGKPVGDALVEVRETETGVFPAEAYTDRVSGRFSTPATLKPGQYAVVVQSEQLAASWRMSVVDKALPAQKFVLEPGSFITGKVVTASGKPVVGAWVGGVQPVSDHVPRNLFRLQSRAATDADGKFRLGPLPEGAFQITALAQSPRRQADVTARTGTARIIRLPPEP